MYNRSFKPENVFYNDIVYKYLVGVVSELTAVGLLTSSSVVCAGCSTGAVSVTFSVELLSEVDCDCWLLSEVCGCVFSVLLFTVSVSTDSPALSWLL